MTVKELLARGPNRTVLSFLEDAVVILSRKSKVVYINPAFERRFNATREAAFGRPLSELLPPRFTEPIISHLELMEPQSPPRRFWLGAEKERFRVSMGAITLDGNAAGAVVTLWDASREIAAKHQNLDLFRALVDDLRLPLAEVRSLLENPRDLGTTLRDGAKNQAEQISESLARLKDFGEVLFGDLRLEPTPFYPSRLVSLARKSLRPLAEQRKVYLEDGSSREMPRLLGDAALLNRLITLLVDYMIKSVPAGQTVIISAELLLMADGQPRIAFAVTGAGVINMEHQLLDRDLDVAAILTGRSDERKRLVLRLFLAQRLVTALNGTMTAAAHEAVGTTLCVQAPVQIHFSA